MDHTFPSPLPPDLVTHVTETLGNRGKEWLAGLPELIQTLEKLWSVKIGEPFPAIEFNFVAPAVRGSDEVVVKVAPPFPDGEFYSECAYLRYRDGDGCISLLAEERDLRAMLIERAIPGGSLTDEFQGRETEAIAPAIAVLKAIRCVSPQQTGDAIILDDWFDNLRRHASSPEFPPEYGEKGLFLYERLTSAGNKEYLHGDFHPGNIVRATRAPFLAIDPKGIIGHIGYDIAVFLNNFHWWQSERSDIRERLNYAVEQFSAAFDITELELRQWAFACRILGAWWTYDEMPAIYSGGVAKADIWDV